ncbi:hypothetical protein LOTGIDRAFT_162789 [Lottia gigantea]|uniref:LRAT domain-containing protein n=1 Tax=Lottia gigantea TaxID=225164 RepID=V3ZL96_LOTGI|nr:hypothetical protein LOTGIDRAFT_162789 [Lottia gigantea]ESO92138.1 hypothetical protein LOTGIDRAFT_162789 [Lottia gigantea]
MDLMVDKHNKTVLSELQPGDIVEFKRGIYSHYGVYIGNEEIVHLSGEDENDGLDAFGVEHIFTISGQLFNKAWVKKDKFLEVAGKSKAYKANKDTKRQPLPAHKIVENSLSKLGRVGYNIITQNCEHFANWCRYETEKSEQVDGFLTAVFLGAAAAGTLAVASHYMGKNKREKNQPQGYYHQ